ncbi:endonuclease domain-containing protein [Polymorphospora rubra]|uniref:endonuclease domain-containing protein n=1 Tax=Polymorphospora rubra TaxID=338584 RepID=UPI001FE25162|nr:DUF559 domain-containing protein [Polymorphospora rubra]
MSADLVAVAVDPLPDGAPTIVVYRPGPSTAADSPATLVDAILAELERAALDLFPAWLPDAAGITGAGGAHVAAVRVLARRAAATSDHFGPFLADLAAAALTRRPPPVGPPGDPGPGPGRPVRAGRFAVEVRATGLARVLAATFGRARTAVVVDVPEEWPVGQAEALVAAGEWLADRGGFGVWLTGAVPATVDHLPAVTVPLPDVASAAGPDPAPGPDPAARPRPEEAGPATGPTVPDRLVVPAVAGRPRADSPAELALEAALSATTWAAGRTWNPTYQSGLAPPVRVDLLWSAERCVVEIDGPEHRSAVRFAADRQRDVRLQLDGYAVLRFTNAQVLHDVRMVTAQIERFLLGRRRSMLEGQPE